LKGGRMSARQRFEPSHKPLPRHFAKPLKK
jgi:hypothetical protein